MKDLLSSNKEMVDYMVNTLKESLKGLENLIKFEEQMMKDLTEQIEDKKDSVNHMMLETSKLKFCIGYLDHPETRKNLDK